MNFPKHKQWVQLENSRAWSRVSVACLVLQISPTACYKAQALAEERVEWFVDRADTVHGSTRLGQLLFHWKLVSQ